MLDTFDYIVIEYMVQDFQFDIRLWTMILFTLLVILLSSHCFSWVLLLYNANYWLISQIFPKYILHKPNISN